MPTSKIVFIDMDDVLCDFTPAYLNSKNNNPDVEFPQSIPGFFERLEPVEGAIDSVRQLQQQFDVYVLSAPSTRNPHSYSEKRIWIEKHFDYPFTKRLILSPNKGLLKGDFLIDDHITGKGQDAFEGEVLHFGSESFPDWRSVIDYLSDV